jgi:hypothetical protein
MKIRLFSQPRAGVGALACIGVFYFFAVPAQGAEFKFPELTQAERKAIIQESIQAMRKHVTGRKEPGDELRKEILGSAILKLNPVRVRNANLNIVIVLKEDPEMEEGLYVSNPISSFAPGAGGEMLIWERLGDKEDRTWGALFRYKLKKTPKTAPSPPAA